LGNLLLLPIEPDANQSLGGVLLKQPFAGVQKVIRMAEGADTRLGKKGRGAGLAGASAKPAEQDQAPV
jgi:hypothetical protein